MNNHNGMGNGSGSGGRPRSDSLSKKKKNNKNTGVASNPVSNHKNTGAASSPVSNHKNTGAASNPVVKNNSKSKKKKKQVSKPELSLVPKHNPVELAKYVTDEAPQGEDDELSIRVYLYGADDRLSTSVDGTLAELFGKDNVHKIDYPFNPDEFTEGMLHETFEQIPIVGFPRNKVLSHVFRLAGQYGTPAYHGIHPGNHSENDKVLTQMEYKIGHAVQQNTNNQVVMFQVGTLGAYSPNLMLIGLQTP